MHCRLATYQEKYPEYGALLLHNFTTLGSKVTFCVLVGVDISSIVMCIYPHGSHIFYDCAYVNSTFLGRVTHCHESRYNMWSSTVGSME